MYKNDSDAISFPEVERRLLASWDQDKIFKKTVAGNKPEMVFYDGPPFPTGAPHYGTIFVSILKDALARFFTMDGWRVPRRWGWDCHGLPIENAVEKQLGIRDKTEIETGIGVAAFNQTCRRLVADCNNAWEIYVRKIGRWVDYHNAYRTLDADYMETVLWVFKQAYDRGLIYRDYRVTPYCYQCETALSISDTRESDSTRPRQDPEVLVMFPAQDQVAGLPAFFLAWTTTPWTMPSNLALAVGENFDYVACEYENRALILAEKLLPRWEDVLGKNPRILERWKGRDLVGRRYQPLFACFANTADQGSFRVLAADFVTLEEGVGVVHCAPAFGEDDYWLCKRHGVPVRNPVDARGCFTEEVAEFAGRNVHECNRDVIRAIKQMGRLLAHRTLEHNYPHCWRCRTPLIYRAMDAWYFAVEKIKPDLMRFNEEINWVPAHVKHGRFGKWLAGARDWNISRSRYWGTPIPVWICENAACGQRMVLGSRAEIAEAAGQVPPDLHKEHLDQVLPKCPACASVMRRVPEVLDCWFESGAMPFGQCHYPFENREWFESHFPADFIVEYPGQIRGWFYYLHVLGVALLGRAAFKNCLVHGTLLAEDGAKISKSRGNFTDPMELIDRHGADALRLYLMSSPAVLMEDMNFKDAGVQEQTRRVLLPLWNAYSFFATYANIDGYRGDPRRRPESTNQLDRWILALLRLTSVRVHAAYRSFHLNQSLAPILDFIDDLTNWYIRQSRARFWGGGLSEDKRMAYDTLYYVILNTARLLAPAAPFVSDEIFRNLTGEPSVHLEAWPDIPATFHDQALLDQTRLARLVVSLGLALRQRRGMRVRQPLRCLQVVLPPEQRALLTDAQQAVVRNELNVKAVELLEDWSKLAELRVSPDARAIGPIWGKTTQRIIRAAKAGQAREDGRQVIVYDKDQQWPLERHQVALNYVGRAGADVMADQGVLVALDCELTPDLVEEGIANELNRIIQDMRKQAGYDVSDRIELAISGPLPETWRVRLAELALASIADLQEKDADIIKKEEIAGDVFRVLIRRVSAPAPSKC